MSHSKPNQSLLLVIAGLLIFTTGFWSGQTATEREQLQQAPQTVSNADVDKPSSVDFKLFWEAWNKVSDKYVKSPDDNDRVQGAIGGMVAGLGDPYSVYMKPTESEQFNQEISGNFEGIGAELVQKDGSITVVAPLDESPAQAAGLLAGDIIVKVDGKEVPSTLEETVKQIRGASGTAVKLTVVRSGEQKDITITRAKVEVKSASYTKKGEIGIIKLNQFNANTTALLDETLSKAKADNVKGIVLDLRNNPGGLLNVSVEVSSRFMEPGVVVVERDKDKKETELKTVSVRDRVTVPMIVLVNKGSASASEIVAGAMQDSNRAKVIGETSFGKGSVQSIEPLSDGSSVRITVAEWLTPKKREINKQGIKPDVEVVLSEDDIKANRDPQLDKALELLK